MFGISTLSKRISAWVAKPNTREQVLDQSPKTAGYSARPIAFSYVNWMDRPPFSLYMADLMQLDPRVSFGLAISNAMQVPLEVEITGPNKRVNDFVMEQWDRFWRTSRAKVLRAQVYGWMPFEVMYREERGLVSFDGLRDMYPSDAKPLTLRGHLRGIKIEPNSRYTSGTAQGPTGQIFLSGMKALWLTCDEQFGNRFGRSMLLPAYPPWYEKTMKGGAIDLRRLRMVKDAWIGDGVRYPENKEYPNADGSMTGARAIALELTDLRASGGSWALPSTRDGNGNLEWEYAPPTDVSGVTQLLEYVMSLDAEEFDGLLVPREVVEAAETGSGFSGRSIPFVTGCAIRDLRAGEIVSQFKAQSIDKMVAMNFGLEATKGVELKPKPLLESIGKMMGDMGQPNTQSGGGSGMMLSQLMQRGGKEQPADGEDDAQDDDMQFATVEAPASRRDKRQVRRATAAATAIATDVRDRLEVLLKKKD